MFNYFFHSYGLFSYMAASSLFYTLNSIHVYTIIIYDESDVYSVAFVFVFCFLFTQRLKLKKALSTRLMHRCCCSCCCCCCCSRSHSKRAPYIYIYIYTRPVARTFIMHLVHTRVKMCCTKSARAV